jgi:hypothetical protein
MKIHRLLLISLLGLPAGIAAASPATPAERLGTVSFPVSCASAVQARFTREMLAVQ